VNSESLQAEVAALRQQVAQKDREIALLRQKLDALARRLFGKKSEQLSAAQLELLLSGLAEGALPEGQEEKEPPARQLPPRSPARPQRLRTPDNLEVVREVIEPDLVAQEPEKWKWISQEISRRLDYQPGKFFWHETVRPKYVRIDNRQLPPVVAPAPVSIADHTLAAPGLVAQLLVSKFGDHVPFYRQEQIFAQRHGVFISRQQMVQWTAQSVRLLSAITRCLKEQLQRSRYAQIDETPVRYQDPDLSGKCGQGYLWTALVPGQFVVYEWHASRAASCLESLLGPNYAGKIQCDGYSAYPAFAKNKDGVQLFGCMAHLRRGFFEAQDQAPKTAGWFLNQIGQLYKWERQLRDNRAGPALRQAVRSADSRMVFRRIGRALTRLQPRYLPQSPMGQAISYALNQWTNVERFLDHGEVEIDNNKVENSIRPTALGKRNWLFFGSDEAGERNAVIYTLIENCRMHGIEPCAYLKDLLERLPRMTNQEVSALIPSNWKKAQPVRTRLAA